MTTSDKKYTVLVSTTLATIIALAAILFVTPTVEAQQQWLSGGGSASGADQNRNQTRTQDPTTHQNTTSNYQQQNQTQQQSYTGQGQQDRNQTRTRDPSTHNAILQERWLNQTQAQSGELHRMHLGLNAQTVEPYIANLNYTLTAEGTAVSFMDTSDIQDASVSIQMSIWRSNERIISMDILEGTVTIGGSEETIQAGGVYYLTHIKQLRVYGLVQYEGDDGNTYVKLFKIASSSVENFFPTAMSEPSYTFESSTSSRLDAEYYLRLSGEAIVS